MYHVVNFGKSTCKILDIILIKFKRELKPTGQWNGGKNAMAARASSFLFFQLLPVWGGYIIIVKFFCGSSYNFK